MFVIATNMLINFSELSRELRTKVYKATPFKNNEHTVKQVVHPDTLLMDKREERVDRSRPYCPHNARRHLFLIFSDSY